MLFTRTDLLRQAVVDYIDLSNIKLLTLYVEADRTISHAALDLLRNILNDDPGIMPAITPETRPHFLVRWGGGVMAASQIGPNPFPVADSHRKWRHQHGDRLSPSARSQIEIHTFSEGIFSRLYL